MADSTEDLRREMEEFEQAEATPTIETPGSLAPAQRRVPSWVYWMVAADVIIGIAVVLVLVAI